MYFVIVGAGHVGSHIAESLVEKSDRLTIIDRLEETTQQLSKRHPNIQVLFGDGSDIDVLKKANVEKADAVVASTNSDAINLRICEIAKNEFKVPHVIALLNNPRNREFFEEQRVVDTIISPIDMAVAFFETAIKRQDVITLLNMKEENFSVAEFIVFPDTKLIGRVLGEISLPDDSRIGVFKRGKRSTIPKANTRVQAGDILFLYGTKNAVKRAIQNLRRESGSN